MLKLLQDRHSRRRLLRYGLATAAFAHIPVKSLFAQQIIVDVTQPPYNASPNLGDNTPAFQAALNAIAAAGGGVLVVPPGGYTLAGQLNYLNSNASLTVMGYGSALSILVVTHNQTALNVSYSYPGDNQQLVIKEIGFAAAGAGAQLGTALSLTMPNVVSGWKACRIENVDFGVQYPNYTSFSTAVQFTNVSRSRLENCNAHGNTIAGGTFLSLNGKCVDNFIHHCTIDGYVVGVAVNAYCEGVHISETVFIGGSLIQTGSTNYNNGINLLGLYVSGGEVNCNNTNLNLFQVNSGWVRDTDFSFDASGAGTRALLTNCGRLEFADCLFQGGFNVQTPSSNIAISLVNTGGCSFDNCSFENEQIAIQVGSGTANCTGFGLRMFALGLGSLVNTPITYGSYVQQPVYDISGNTSNTFEWVASTNATSGTNSKRTIFSR